MALSQWLKAVFIAAFFVCGSALAQSAGDFVVVPTPGATKINGAAGFSGSAQVDGYGDLSVLNAAPGGTPIPFIVNPADTTATSTLDMTSIASNLTVSCSGKGSAAFWANRTTETGTLKFQYSDDGTNWNEFGYVPLNLGSATEAVTYIGTGAVATISAASLGATKEVIVPCTGHSLVRALVSSAGVGNLSVFFRANATVFPYLFGIIPGTGAVNLGKARTAASGSTDVGVQALGYVNNSVASIATDGQYSPLSVTVKGAGIENIDQRFQPQDSTGILKLLGGTPGAADAGVGALFSTNTNLGAAINTNNKYGLAAVEVNGALYEIPMASGNANSVTKSQGASYAASDGLMNVGGLIQTTLANITGEADGKYAPLKKDFNGGGLYISGSQKEDVAAVDGAPGVFNLSIRNDTLAGATNANGDYQEFSTDASTALWVRTGELGSYSTTTPSISTATSTTVLASNSSRKSFIIQNNSAANICCSLSSATLTGIVPTGSNVCMVLTAGSSFISPANFTDTAAITCYQTSGGTLNNVVVMES